MRIIQIEPNNKQQVNQFIQLPFSIYRQTPQWVPPLMMDVRKIFNLAKHPFYENGEAAFFLSLGSQEQITGRIAVLENKKYNAYHQSRVAFFYLFECVDDSDVSNALFEKAFAWARGRGLEHILGPKGFTPLDGLGMLTKGFEHRPAFGLPYNLPYYPRLLKQAGFSAQRTLASGYMDANSSFPAKFHQLAERIRQRRGLTVASYKTRKDLRSLIPQLKALYNGTLTGTSGNAPLSDAEIQVVADQLLWFADPRLIKVVFKGDQAVGFLLAYPDISAAIQKTGGKVFPFGWIRLFRELKQTKWVNINGAGMIEGYRGLGGTALLFSEMYKAVKESGYSYADLVQIGLENERMQRELRNLGIDFYKQHTVYECSL